MYELNHFIPIQFNFALEAKGYQCYIVNKKTYSLLFYQYVTSAQQRSVSIIPDGCVDIQFLCEPDNPLINLCGTTLNNENKEHTPNQLYVGVRFSPSVSRRIGWIPYQTLTNNIISSGSINIVSQTLLEQLCLATSFAERMQLVDQWLTRLSIPGEPIEDEIEYCMREIHNHSGNISLTALAQDIGFSDRRLRQKFTNELGIAPKLYCRIQRFQRALNYLEHQKHTPIRALELAKKFNYYDESHVIKEFQEFSQYSPLSLQEKFRLSDLSPAIH